MPEQHRRYYEDDYRRGSQRSWSGRENDETRFAEDDARGRREFDERDERYRYGGERRWQSQIEPRGSMGGRGDRGYGERGYYGSDRARMAERGYGGGYGERGRYGSGGFAYGRDDRGDWNLGMAEDDWRTGDYGGPGDEEPQRWGAEADWVGRGGFRESRRERSSFGGYGTTGYGSGRYESGAYPVEGYGGGSMGSRFGTGYGWGSRPGGAAGAFRHESYAGRGPKDYKRSDERIREEVSDRLTDDPAIDASEITVHVQNCEVTLTGSVESREQKRRAEDLVESVSGVAEVTNNLRVHRHLSSEERGSGKSGAAGLFPSGSGQQQSEGGTAKTREGRPTVGSSA